MTHPAKHVFIPRTCLKNLSVLTTFGDRELIFINIQIECIDFGDNFNEFTIDQTVEPFMHKAARHFKDKTGSQLMKMYLVLSSAIDTISGEISDHAHSIYHQYFLDNVVR